MRHWLRPRTLIAFCAAIAMGLAAWMLPPMPEWRATLPEDAFLWQVSSDGRYLITCKISADEPTMAQVWDREGDLHEPVLTARAWRTLWSPDECRIAVVWDRDTRVLDVKLFELATGRLLKTYENAGGHVFFAGDGRLLAVKADAVYDLDDGRELHPLPAKIDGSEVDWDCLGAFAIGQLETPPSPEAKKHRHIYSLATVRAQCVCTLPLEHMAFHGISQDGRVIFGEGCGRAGNAFVGPVDVLIDSADGGVQIMDDEHYTRISAISPDGQWIVWRGYTPQPAWLPQWWPTKDEDRSIHITHWRSGAEWGGFRDLRQVCFSPDGKLLALTRGNGVIEGYAFPWSGARWGLVALAALMSAGATWSVGWLWSHSRARKGGAA